MATDKLARFVIQNLQTKEVWTPNGPSHNKYYAFPSHNDAESILSSLENSWQIAEIAVFSDNRPKPIFDITTVLPENNTYQAPPGTIASQIKVHKGEHITVCGEVQVGKLYEKLETILMLIKQYNKPVLLLFRNNNLDIHQFSKRLREFNRKQRKFNKPVLPEPIEVLNNKDQLGELLLDANLFVGLANPSTFETLEKCLKQHPETKGKLVLILDEADLVAFELQHNNKEDFTKTEASLQRVFDDLYMLISVTGTPGVILLCDKESQVLTIPRPSNYYGIQEITIVPIEPIKKGSKSQQYDPVCDKENLQRIMGDILDLPSATLLVSVSRICKDHKNVIKYLSEWNKTTAKDIVYLELNEKSIKVYNKFGQEMDAPITKQTIKGKKVGPIDEALERYKGFSHIVIVAGVLAGRGISFVSTGYERHLSHQYIAGSKTTHLETAIQNVRLLGRYNDKPKLILYCKSRLADDLIAQSEDMRNFVAIAKETKDNKEKLPEVMKLQNKYCHTWFGLRKLKGLPRTMSNLSVDYEFSVEDYSRDLHDKYTFNIIITNIKRNFPKFLLGGQWPGGRNKDKSITAKTRAIYCNPRSDFSREGIIKFIETDDFTIKEEKQNDLKDPSFSFPHYNDLLTLYKAHPEYEGKVLTQKIKAEAESTVCGWIKKEEL